MIILFKFKFTSCYIRRSNIIFSLCTVSINKSQFPFASSNQSYFSYDFSNYSLSQLQHHPTYTMIYSFFSFVVLIFFELVYIRHLRRSDHDSLMLAIYQRKNTTNFPMCPIPPIDMDITLGKNA